MKFLTLRTDDRGTVKMISSSSISWRATGEQMSKTKAIRNLDELSNLQRLRMHRRKLLREKLRRAGDFTCSSSSMLASKVCQSHLRTDSDSDFLKPF